MIANNPQDLEEAPQSIDRPDVFPSGWDQSLFEEANGGDQNQPLSLFTDGHDVSQDWGFDSMSPYPSW